MEQGQNMLCYITLIDVVFISNLTDYIYLLYIYILIYLFLFF